VNQFRLFRHGQPHHPRGRWNAERLEWIVARITVAHQGTRQPVDRRILHAVAPRELTLRPAQLTVRTSTLRCAAR
jgi:hypothetical protein